MIPNLLESHHFWCEVIASYQNLQNDAILINHESFFQEKDSLQLTVSNFLKGLNYYQIQQFFYKNIVLENCFLMISAIKEIIS